MIRRGLHIALLLSISVLAKAQNEPLYDTYFTNNYLINPAITGIDPFPELQVTYRSQWGGHNGLIDGAPQNWLVSYHGSIGNNYAMRSFSGKVPGKAIPYPRNTAFSRHSGMGIIAYRERIGLFQTTQIAPSYARHLPLSRNVQFSLGVSVALRWHALDESLLHLADPNDPFITNFDGSTESIWNLGGLLSSRKWFAGFSMAVNSTNRSSRYLGMAGLRIPHSKLALSYQPFLLIRYSALQHLNADLGLKIEFQEMFFLGGLVRTTMEGSFFGGLNLPGNKLGLTASYNTSAGKNELSNFQNGSLEFSLIFRMSKNGFIPCKTTPSY